MFVLSLSSTIIFNFINKKYIIQNYITIIIALTLISTSAVNSGGLNRPILFWILAIPSISGMMLGKKGIIPSTILTLTTIGIVFLIHYLGFSHDTIPRGKDGDLSVIYRAGFGTIILSAVFAYITQHTIKNINITTLKINKQIKGISRNVGHDILSSLSIVMSSIEILEMNNENLTQESTKQITQLKYKATDIYDIVSSIKKIQSIESGKSPICLENINLYKCINEKIDYLSSRYKDKNIHFSIDDSIKDLPNVLIDYKPLKESILKAIISNAIKYSYPNGTVKISSSTDEKFVSITIEDKGIGIPKNISKNIFLPTATISRKGTAGEIGAGLALFIAKEYMNFYGGDITFSTRPSGRHFDNTGTIFTLKFKIKQLS
jgi:signal transduction histidine kinase